MGGLNEVSSAVAEVKDFLSWGRRTLERKLFVLVDPVSWDGDRGDVPIAGESVDLADYEVFWDCGNPNSARALDSGVVRVWWIEDTDAVKCKRDSTPDQIPGAGRRDGG